MAENNTSNIGFEKQIWDAAYRRIILENTIELAALNYRLPDMEDIPCLIKFRRA